jgi:predicted NAD/FAD-dependent oxidoreductase
MQIGLIGAGASAAATTYALDSAMPAAEITVLEKSGGVCGRAATRRRDEVTYDYGANYVTDDDERATELLTERLDTDGLVDIDEPVWVFDEDETVSEGRDSDKRKLTYRRGLTQIAKRLFSCTDATVHRRTRVETITRTGDSWLLTDDTNTEWGPFDVLVCNPPAPQTAALLADAEWSQSLRDSLVSAIEAVEFRTVWTAILGYEFEIDVPYYALVNPEKDHAVGWIGREECKPGHVPDGESVLVVQANHDWSRDHYDDDPRDNIAALAGMTADIVDDERLADAAWSDHQGWRYALPESKVNRDQIDAASEHGLYFTGDWISGEARLYAALRNGLATGERIANHHSG